MKIYESFGTFDEVNKEFNLAIQTTIVGFDEYYISEYYDICTPERYAIVAILQTKAKNDNDLSPCKANSAAMDSKISFTKLNRDFWEEGDLNIDGITNGDVINVIVHHGIGFDPTTNEYDHKYITNYKAGEYKYYPKGSPPGKHGSGGML